MQQKSPLNPCDIAFLVVKTISHRYSMTFICRHCHYVCVLNFFCVYIIVWYGFLQGKEKNTFIIVYWFLKKKNQLFSNYNKIHKKK